jgi:hypothetical protein
MGLLNSLWIKLAIAAAFAIGIAAFVWRIYKAGGDAQKLRTAHENLQHLVKTAKEVNNADSNLTRGDGARAKRVRDLFTRR